MTYRDGLMWHTGRCRTAQSEDAIGRFDARRTGTHLRDPVSFQDARDWSLVRQLYLIGTAIARWSVTTARVPPGKAGNQPASHSWAVGNHESHGC
jgi:hypothetical protein